jgi:hypothetical protein
VLSVVVVVVDGIVGMVVGQLQDGRTGQREERRRRMDVGWDRLYEGEEKEVRM